MKPMKLESMTVDELIDRYAEICIAEDEALLDDEIGKFNRLFREQRAVDTELRARGKEALLALLRFHVYPNIQVRLQAAKGNTRRGAS
jgi:hypothetical protein